ncbi:MAG TPA: hypothetical protein VNJ70_06050 [Thermoanaerobaculia bacterium]|nr:hypothetical protein [Thermoanaerobaculia bacterium]
MQVVREYWDASGSVDGEAAGTLKRDLAKIERVFQALGTVERWELHPWATLGDLLASKSSKVSIPLPQKVECEKVLGEESILRSIQKQAQEECSRKTDAAIRDFKNSLRQPITAIALARRSLSLHQQARQTCFWRLMQHLLGQSSGAANIVVTDGVDENCGNAPSRLERKGTDTTIVVLLPSKTDQSGRTDPIARTDALRQKLPDVLVIWASEVDPSWDWMLKELRVRPSNK